MSKHLVINSVIVLLFVSLLTNAFGWTFHGEAFAQGLDDHQYTLSFTPVKEVELRQHNDMTDDKNLDFITHLCLHAAGQYQPFYFTLPPLLPAADGKEILAVFFPVTVPESVLDSPFRPPRNISVS
ncbi:MAG: hypothetical protein Q8K59_04755 [Nitrosomonas sp.]|nr:hypothetical protein [Nitrosomonas sp.]MDP1950400.1 hypothetical protein [Nitrosomonas sp.]